MVIGPSHYWCVFYHCCRLIHHYCLVILPLFYRWVDHQHFLLSHTHTHLFIIVVGCQIVGWPWPNRFEFISPSLGEIPHLGYRPLAKTFPVQSMLPPSSTRRISMNHTLATSKDSQIVPWYVFSTFIFDSSNNVLLLSAFGCWFKLWFIPSNHSVVG